MQSVHSKNSTPDDKNTSHIVQKKNLQYIGRYIAYRLRGNIDNWKDALALLLTKSRNKLEYNCLERIFD